jgi:hypothetical protein
MMCSQDDMFHGLLTDLPNINAKTIDKITDLIRCKEIAQVALQPEQRKKIWREVTKKCLEAENITYQDIEVRLGEHLPASFTEDEKEKVLSDPDKALDVFVDLVCLKAENV